MGPTSKFDEYSDEEEFFGDGATEARPAPEEGSEDEEQLIKDGNDQVLKSFETRKKRQEYSRSQASRDKKEPEMLMDIVDWSGFPGSAHKSPGTTAVRKSRSERLARSNMSTPTNDSEKRMHSRSHQRKIAAATGIGATPGEDGGHENPLSPRKEPQRYRNRRHSFKGSLSSSLHGVMAPPGVKAGADAQGDPSTPKKDHQKYRNRRHSFKGTLSNSLHGVTGQAAGAPDRPAEKRPQRRGSGSGKGPRNQRVGPPQSTSPAGRIRRPVNAAAASTMLEGGRKPPQRNGSTGRRQRTQRLTGGSNGALKVPDDGVLASKSSGIKW